MRTLNEIRKDFYSSNDDRDLVNLMNELEKEYNTFCINPSEQELNRPEIQLYREISASRKLTMNDKTM